jgi:hypothetical protein
MKTNLSPEALKSVIDRLTAHVIAECSAVDMEQRFRDSLDSCYPVVTVGGLEFAPSRVMEQLDPVAFRCGVADSSDHENVYEIGNDYYDERDVEEARETFLDTLRAELEDAETALEEEENLEGETFKITRLKAEIEACENHAF